MVGILFSRDNTSISQRQSYLQERDLLRVRVISNLGKYLQRMDSEGKDTNLHELDEDDKDFERGIILGFFG